MQRDGLAALGEKLRVNFWNYFYESLNVKHRDVHEDDLEYFKFLTNKVGIEMFTSVDAVRNKNNEINKILNYIIDHYTLRKHFLRSSINKNKKKFKILDVCII